LENPTELINSPNKLVYVFSNKTILGGLLGGLFCVEFIKKKIGVTSSSGDLMTYPIILGLIIGRIGCFCEGLSDGTVGICTQSFFGVNFGDGLNRHPLALYELFFLILLRLVIYQFDKRNSLADGGKFKVFLISYLIFRFFIEFLKENKFTLGGLSTLQIACILGLIYYFKTLCNIKVLFNKNA
jgi:prolipoprotein diacylglyceryltransferase